MTLDVTKDLAPKYTMTIRIVGMKKWYIRAWIARQLIKLAAITMNMSIKIEDQPWYGADL